MKQNLTNIRKYHNKKYFKSQFRQKPQYVFQRVKVNLPEAINFSRSCDNFFGRFWGTQIVKRNLTVKLLGISKVHLN